MIRLSKRLSSWGSVKASLFLAVRGRHSPADVFCISASFLWPFSLIILSGLHLIRLRSQPSAAQSDHSELKLVPSTFPVQPFALSIYKSMAQKACVPPLGCTPPQPYQATSFQRDTKLLRGTGKRVALWFYLPFLGPGPAELGQIRVIF